VSTNRCTQNNTPQLRKFSPEKFCGVMFRWRLELAGKLIFKNKFIPPCSPRSPHQVSVNAD